MNCVDGWLIVIVDVSVIIKKTHEVQNQMADSCQVDETHIFIGLHQAPLDLSGSEDAQVVYSLSLCE